MHLVCLRYMPQVRNKSVSLFFFVCYTSMYLYGVAPNDTYRIGTSWVASLIKRSNVVPEITMSLIQSDLIGFVQLYNVI